MRGKFLLTGLLLAATVLPAMAQVKVHEWKLDNGLKLIVKEDHRAPVVVSQVWYKIGASYEPNGLTGISHVLEHLMFKGTEKYPAGEFSRIISSNGGRENAFTGRDYTAYFQRLEKSRLHVSFELEADRMRGLLLDDKEFQKEVRVVMEERRLRTEDKPESLTYEQFNATAFVTSPYRNPVIGWMNDLENLNIDDLKSWYQKWYAPNNATVVVVGDVDPKAVLKLARKYFEPLKTSTIRPPRPQLETTQRGLREIRVKTPARVPYILMGYHVPVLKTAKDTNEAYAMEVLAGILDGGDSARLARQLVRDKQIATAAGAGYSLNNRMNGLLLLEANPAQGANMDAVQAALLEQVKQLREQPVTQAELDRVKAQVVANDVYEKDSVFYQAMQIGMLETVGMDWRVGEEYVKRIRAITAEQIQAVAKKYLTEENLTIARLVPLPMDQKKSRPHAVSGGHH